MADNIPAFGIKAYMDGEVQKRLPPNGWWRFLQKIQDSPKWWMSLGILVMLGLMVFDYQRGTTMLAGRGDTTPLIITVFVDAIFVVGFGGYMLWIVVSLPARHPGVWRHYSLKDFIKKYGGWYLPAVEVAMQDIRIVTPMAEFELAALEQAFPNPNKPKHFGLILFKTMERVGKMVPESKDGGQALHIYDEMGCSQQFGKAYAPASSFALRNIQA